MAKTQEYINTKQREYRKLTDNSCTRKYEKSKRGFLMRLYRNMKSRVNGVQKLKAHLYLGKELLPKEEFYAWAINSPNFHILFEDWEKEQYNKRLTPTVDRIDPSIGYFTGNMRWLTHSMNSSLGAINRHGGINAA